jgi:hypothetical protein
MCKNLKQNTTVPVTQNPAHSKRNERHFGRSTTAAATATTTATNHHHPPPLPPPAPLLLLLLLLLLPDSAEWNKIIIFSPVPSVYGRTTLIRLQCDLFCSTPLCYFLRIFSCTAERYSQSDRSDSEVFKLPTPLLFIKKCLGPLSVNFNTIHFSRLRILMFCDCFNFH